VRRWYGTIEVVSDQTDGVRTEDGVTIPQGEQRFAAISLEGMLGRRKINDSAVRSVGTVTHLARALEFNAGGVGNRSAGRFDGAFVFGSDKATNEIWSVRDIVVYLIGRQATRSAGSDDPFDKALPIQLDRDAVFSLPDWDIPVIKAQGKTVAEILGQLIARQRLRTWWLEVLDVPNAPDVGFPVLLKVRTLTPVAINLGANKKILANANQLAVNVDTASTSNLKIKSSSLDQYDQVIVTGRRRRSCFTIAPADGTIVAGWSATLQTAYNAGASGAADYPLAAEIADREKRNTKARTAESLESVYARFALPDDWDLFARDGEGGTAYPVFPDDDQPIVSYAIYTPDIAILRSLPLLTGHDYSFTRRETSRWNIDPPETDVPPFEERPPLVVIPEPGDTSRFGRVQDMAAAAETEDSPVWSGIVRVPDDEPALIVRVSGKPQHVLAGGDFVPIDANDPAIGPSDWRELIFTVAINDDRFAEARYPAEVDDLDIERDEVRTLNIPAGDSYKLDYLAPDTVVGIDPTDGSLIRNTVGGWINDDRDKLLEIAKIAYAWYSTPRAAVVIDTSDIGAAINLGDLIVSVGDSSSPGDHQIATNSVVTSIGIQFPRSSGASPINEAPRMSIATQFVNLDPLQA
jgi:hypothetical protein